MSELKTIYAEDTFDEDYMEYHHSDKRYYREVYLKAEADAVIAELKAQKAQTEDDCAYWKTMAQKNAADNAVMAKQRAEALKKESRHKYKRCLDKAKWCFTKSNYHFVLARHGEDVKKNNRKYVLYSKWRKRWLELAEKFKEAK